MHFWQAHVVGRPCRGEEVNTARCCASHLSRHRVVSYSHRKEYTRLIKEAIRDETRARSIKKAVAM